MARLADILKLNATVVCELVIGVANESEERVFFMITQLLAQKHYEKQTVLNSLN